LYDSYDSANRLLDYERGTLTSGGGSISTSIALPNTNQEQAYALDKLGNWPTTTITSEGGSPSIQTRYHNPLNQVTAYGVYPAMTPVLYDQGNNSGTPPQKGNGNIIDDGVRTYAYDAFNRLMIVKRKSDSQVIGAYAYDCQNRRIRKAVSNGGLTGDVPDATIRFIYDGAQVAEELNAATSATQIQYVWGQYIDELIQMKTYVSTGPQGLAAGAYYLLIDLLYRSAALTNNTGSIVEAYDTDAYGNTLLFKAAGTGGWFSADDVQASYPACRYVFTGREYDAETQIYFYRSRYFDPVLGRFLGRDAIDYAGGMNLFDYIWGNPTASCDPSGFLCDGSTGPTLGAFSGINSKTNYLTNDWLKPAGYSVSKIWDDVSNLSALDALIPGFKCRLNHEARHIADTYAVGALCCPCAKTPVHILMLAPKTNTKPPTGPRLCCNLSNTSPVCNAAADPP
jgi:RHS repeat-associated protein